MKNNFLALLFLISIFSCRKSELDLVPSNQLPVENAFNTETDVSLAVGGMYAGLRTSGSYYVSGTWNIIADVLADNLIISQAGRQTQRTFSEWLYNGDATYGLFAGGYSINRRANAILENIEKFSNGAFKDNAKGEALALRAMVFFDMSRVYGKTFLNASAADSVMPYVTTTDVTILPRKESVAAFYAKVIKDLTDALPLIATTNGVGRLNKAAVSGILSRVYLYQGNWAACITESNTALTATPNLPNIATFPSIWTDATNAGVLFKVINTSLDNVNTPGVNYYQVVGAGVRSEYVVDFNLRQQYLATDVRTASYIQTSPFNGVMQNHVVKYNGRPGQPAGVVDGKALRTAEVLLNRAEANYRSSNQTAALADLNLLKANRYTGFVNITLAGVPLLNEILRERRLELAFEGDRFWDLKRLNLPVQRDGTKGDRADGTGVTYLFLNLPVTGSGSHKFQLPYPTLEVNFNKNLTQNPGY